MFPALRPEEVAAVGGRSRRPRCDRCSARPLAADADADADDDGADAAAPAPAPAAAVAAEPSASYAAVGLAGGRRRRRRRRWWRRRRRCGGHGLHPGRRAHERASRRAPHPALGVGAPAHPRRRSQVCHHETLGWAATTTLKHTFFASLMAAVAIPGTIMKATSLLDNPWSLRTSAPRRAASRSRRRCCCRALTAGVPSSSSAFLSARDWSSSAWRSWRRSSTAAAPTRPGSCNTWCCWVCRGRATASGLSARRVVAGRVVNCYRPAEDLVLSLVYRTSSLAVDAVAGLAPVRCDGVENVDVSDVVSATTATASASARSCGGSTSRAPVRCPRMGCSRSCRRSAHFRSLVLAAEDARSALDQTGRRLPISSAAGRSQRPASGAGAGGGPSSSSSLTASALTSIPPRRRRPAACLRLLGGAEQRRRWRRATDLRRDRRSPAARSARRRARVASPHQPAVARRLARAATAP